MAICFPLRPRRVHDSCVGFCDGRKHDLMILIPDPCICRLQEILHQLRWATNSLDEPIMKVYFFWVDTLTETRASLT